MNEIPLGASGPSRQGFGIGIVLFAGIFIGLLPNAAKIAYQEGANPLAVLTVRSVLGMMGLGIYLSVSGGRFKIGWPAFRFNAVPGAAYALASLGIMGAVAYIDVSLAILIVFLHPFFIAIVEHFRGGSRLTPVLVACIAVALVGLGLALAVRLDSLDTRGIGLAMTGAVAATAMVLLIVRVTKQVGPSPPTFI